MKISVCLITYNGSSFINEQIDSILAQSTPVHEIIVSDDASSDNTLTILNNYSLRYPELFTILSNHSNKGAVLNIEKAIQAATGEIIFLADQDDIWIPKKVELTLDFLKQNPNIKGVFSNGLVINDQSAIIKDTFLWDTMSFPFQQLDSSEKKIDLLKYITEVENFATGATMAFYKSLPFLSQPFPVIEGMFHDRWIAMNLCLANQLGCMNQPLIKYRLHQQQVIGGKKNNLSYYLNINERLYLNNFSNINFKQYKDLANRCTYNLKYLEVLRTLNLDDYNTAKKNILSLQKQLDKIAKTKFPFLFGLRKFKKALSYFF